MSDSSAILAATAVANAANADGSTGVTCAVSLTPRVCEADNGEIAESLYAVPQSLRTSRETRTAFGREVTVSLVYLGLCETEEEAQSAVADFQETLDAILAEGRRNGVCFRSYDMNELYDQELLADQRVLRMQADFDCVMFG